VRCEVVAVGSELLLGHVVDTNSAWLGERLAAAGIDSHFRTTVGDNQARIASALRTALDRSDAVVVCGGLGPTQDDITREAVAEVMGVHLERDQSMVQRIRRIFEARGRDMAPSNERQADVPVGAVAIPQSHGTAPGLICPVGDKVVYAVPGVPFEMEEMVERAVLPDLRARAGTRSTIVSSTLCTWGLPESALADVVAPRVRALDAAGGNPTIAFLARGIEGIRIRVTAKAETEDAARAMVGAEHEELRKLLGTAVFGVDDDTMEDAVGALLEEKGLTLGLAESMTGGLAASRVVNVEGSSGWFRGAVVSYDSEVKFDLLGVPEGPVVTEEAARTMAQGACKVLGADVGLSITGVAGPVEQEGKPVGTTFFGVCVDGSTEVTHSQLPGDRERVRQFAVISVLDLLRRRLLDGTA
jgi:nicotinamide-nucleotide amidase